jgi:DNA-binding transcriptional MocR family regulator
MHHYSHPQGLLSLRQALAKYMHAQHPHIQPEHVVVTHGGTHALNLACQVCARHQ